MVHGKAEDAGGLSPAKDDNEVMRHFIRRTLPILDCVDYTAIKPADRSVAQGKRMRLWRPRARGAVWARYWQLWKLYLSF